MTRRTSKKALQMYKDLIDALAARRENGYGDWIRKGGFPDFPHNATINALLKQLTPSQKKAVAEIAQRSRDSGMHDVLVELQERQDLQGLRLVQRGIELPVLYFERMYYDFICRISGDQWPDERGGRKPRKRRAVRRRRSE